MFALALGINIAMWAIDYFAVNVQASYYYSNAKTVSSYTDTVAYADSSFLFTNSTNGIGSAVAVAMSLIYSWVLWKASLVVFAY